MTEYRIALITINSPEAARVLARQLVEEHLAACVNIMPRLTSVYHWQGQIEEDEESLLICKTHARLWEAFMRFVREHHPYDVPEIIALPILEGHPDYMTWLATTLGVK